MEFIERLLNVELGLPARFIIAFVTVLVLIGLTAWIIRRIGGGRGVMGAARPRGRRRPRAPPPRVGGGGAPRAGAGPPPPPRPPAAGGPG
jgi:hypothetical protein